MSANILAIDQGTTGTTCLVVRVDPDTKAAVLGKGYQEFPQHFPQPGWVEHDLMEIWQATLAAIAEAVAAAQIAPSAIAAIGITNQRETTGVWDRAGKPISRAIVWQDRRTAPRCQELRAAGHTERIATRTGLVVDPYFSGTKIAWLLDQVPGARERAARDELRFGTIDTWLCERLTGGEIHITDVTNASRTMLLDVQKGTWDPEMCALCGDIPLSMLPEVRGCSEIYGTTKGLELLPDNIPIAGIAGDQQAALFGQACFLPGMAKCTYGTGAFALVNTGTRPVFSRNRLLTTIAWKLGDTTTYAVEGSAFIAGAVVQWLRDGLGFFAESPEVETLASSVKDSGGVTLVPALVGLGAPHWRPEARGLITGITRGTTRAHIARAALEGIALQIHDLLAAMREDTGEEISLLRVDGGAAANDLLMQFQADLLGVEIHRPTFLETTALGACYLAALAIGVYSGVDEVTKSWALDATYRPQMSPAQVGEHVERWHQAVQKA